MMMRRKAEKSDNKNNNNEIQRYELTDEDLDQVAGGRDMLLGKDPSMGSKFLASIGDTEK